MNKAALVLLLGFATVFALNSESSASYKTNLLLRNASKHVATFQFSPRAGLRNVSLEPRSSKRIVQFIRTCANVKITVAAYAKAAKKDLVSSLCDKRILSYDGDSLYAGHRSLRTRIERAGDVVPGASHAERISRIKRCPTCVCGPPGHRYRCGSSWSNYNASLRSDARPAPPSMTPPADSARETGGKISVGSEVLKDASRKEQTSDPRLVDILYATNRDRDDAPGATRASYNSERLNTLRLGAARIRIPENHKMGMIELPTPTFLEVISLRPAKSDPKTNFVIDRVLALDKAAWLKLAENSKADEALVFVHGYWNTFDDALLRAAQIKWDAQYKGLVVAFSWPSRGTFVGYVFDRDSALGARDRFLDLLYLLQVEVGIKKVNVVAHSMGNLVVVEALAGYARTANPRSINELIMAAPDVDKSMFEGDITDVAKVTTGMTLYASGADKALRAAREIASGAPRAGDILNGEPIVFKGVDSIDVTTLGEDFFGLNHDVFAAARSVITDMKLLLTTRLRPPNERVPEIRAFPEGLGVTPRYWRFVP